MTTLPTLPAADARRDDRRALVDALAEARERLAEFEAIIPLLYHEVAEAAPQWRTMDTAPKDRFIILRCDEDGSRWWAKWQGDRWWGVDEFGLTRSGASAGDPNVVTGWFVNAWMPLPAPPAAIRAREGGGT